MPIKQKTIWKESLEISTDLYEQHPLLVFPEPEGDVFAMVHSNATPAFRTVAKALRHSL